MAYFFSPPQEIDLPGDGTCDSAAHVFDEKSILAINAAIACRRPLLVRGLPGTGKTQLAKAAAVFLNRPLIAEVITSNTENRDLHWHFDAVARLAQAQILGMLPAEHREDLLRKLEEKRFLRPGPVWWAFDWESAHSQNHYCVCKYPEPATPDTWTPDKGVVLLLDEIDKADADVPNGLLECLGSGSFHPPYVEKPVVQKKETEPLLTIITTNEESELPLAFVRRCLVLELCLPKEKEALLQWLVERGKAHFPDSTEQLRKQAAVQLIEDRDAAQSKGMVIPGQAEYIDLLRAVLEMQKKVDNDMSALDILRKISEFSFRKNPSVLQ